MLINTPIGNFQIKYDDDFIYKIIFEKEITLIENKNYRHNSLSEKIKKQFDEYFSGKRMIFDLPYKLDVFPFTSACYSELLKVQYATTTTYGNIATTLGKPNAARAVGNAMNKNPLPIIIPCHRVLGGNGKLVGYRGGLDTKQWLLDFERNNK